MMTYPPNDTKPGGKPGRNDPCPCGSGRKYKHCCLAKAKATAVDPGELAWRRVRRAIDPTGQALMKTALQHFGEAGLTEAWNEFHLADQEDDERFDPHSPFSEVFRSWFIFHWLPDPHGTELPAALQDRTAAQVHLARAGRKLDPIARSYIEAACGTAFSFHEALEVQPGSGMRLRDVLLDEEHEVHERSGSRNLAPGDMLFAKLVPVGGLVLIEGMGPAAVPPSAKPAIIELRRKITASIEGITVERLNDWDIEIRELYLDIAEDVLDPAPPDIRNSDGDPLEMHTLHYELDAPSAAFDALKDLATGWTQQDLESGARRNDSGELLSADVPWIREDKISLGTINIEGTRLKAEVNSAERAARLRELIGERLAGNARAQPSVVQSAASLLAESGRISPEERARQAKEQAELAAMPEVRAAIDERLRMHYSGWIDTALPALGGRTPRAAVADADGREAVEALIRSIERNGAKLSPPLDPAIVAQMRETLGLAGG